MSAPKQEVAIIVPFNTWHDWVLDCVRALSALNGLNKDWTCWLVPDEAPDASWRERLNAFEDRLRMEILATGRGNPSEKRNAVLRATRAPIVALLDSDAWPDPDWLVRALPHLNDDVGVITGPNLTPPEDPLLRRVCGRVMESRVGFGEGYIRHVPVSARDVREMPTCNMVFRRVDDMTFREELATGEDMAFCSDMRAAGYRVRYTPDVRVFHHRRTFPAPFMRQFYGYGLNKGRLRSEGSDIAYLWHAVPALFVVYLVLALIGSVRLSGGIMVGFLWLPFGVYLLAILWESARKARTVGEFLLCPSAFFAAHLAYGTGYLVGLGRGKLRS